MNKFYILLTLIIITLFSAQCTKNALDSALSSGGKNNTTNTPTDPDATLDDILGKTIEIEALGCQTNAPGFNENGVPAEQKGGLFNIGCFTNWAKNNLAFGSTNDKVSRGKFYIKFEKNGNSYDMLSWSTDPLLREPDLTYPSNIARPFFYLGELSKTNRLSEITSNTLLFKGMAKDEGMGLPELTEVKNNAATVDISLAEGGKRVQLLFTDVAGGKGPRYEFTITGKKSDPTTIKVYLKYNLIYDAYTAWSDPYTFHFINMVYSAKLRFEANVARTTLPLEYVVTKID